MVNLFHEILGGGGNPRAPLPLYETLNVNPIRRYGTSKSVNVETTNIEQQMHFILLLQNLLLLLLFCFDGGGVQAVADQ